MGRYYGETRRAGRGFVGEIWPRLADRMNHSRNGVSAYGKTERAAMLNARRQLRLRKGTRVEWTHR